MRHYAGLDVSVKETSVCIVDETGKICREVKTLSHPEDLLRVLQDAAWHLERVGLEAGPLSQWLFEGLTSAGLPVVCIEARRIRCKPSGNSVRHMPPVSSGGANVQRPPF
jgi:transposase